MTSIISGKFCGNCEYWNGERKKDRKGVAVDKSGANGHCNHKTMSKTIDHAANQPACPKFEEWK